MSIDMTPEQRAAADKMLAQLHTFGYVDIQAHGALAAGVRVRHRGHHYPSAYEHGTGVVVAIVERPDSSWSQTYGMPDIEMVVLNDRDEPKLSQLAQYHVEVIGGAS